MKPYRFKIFVLLSVFLVSFGYSRGKIWKLTEYLKTKPENVYLVKNYNVKDNDSYKEFLDSVQKTLEDRFGINFVIAERIKDPNKAKAIKPANNEPVYVKISCYGVVGLEYITKGNQITSVGIQVGLWMNKYSTSTFPYYDDLVTVKKKGKIAFDKLYDEFKTSYGSAIAEFKKKLEDPAEVNILKVVNAKKKMLELDIGSDNGYSKKEKFFVIKEVDGDDPLTYGVEKKHYIGVAALQIKSLGADKSQVQVKKLRKGTKIEDLPNYKTIHFPKHYDDRYKVK